MHLAKRIGEEITRKFGLDVGNYHEKPIGPHLKWSVQIAFTSEYFEAFIPWLDEHRCDLNILVHGVTGNDLKDHTEYAYWLGKSEPLDISMFEQRA